MLFGDKNQALTIYQQFADQFRTMDFSNLPHQTHFDVFAAIAEIFLRAAIRIEHRKYLDSSANETYPYWDWFGDKDKRAEALVSFAHETVQRAQQKTATYQWLHLFLDRIAIYLEKIADKKEGNFRGYLNFPYYHRCVSDAKKWHTHDSFLQACEKAGDEPVLGGNSPKIIISELMCH